ncbi:MAG: hypothetical protein AB9897_05955 [Anaerolineaceae bacterium]
MSSFSAGKCEQCVNYVNLTEIELNYLKPTFKKLNLENNLIKGACVRPGLNPPLLINRYPGGNETDCMFFEKGFYLENLNYSCPECDQGKMVIRRPKINSQPRIMFSCNRYPMCKKIINIIELETLCRFCKVPLELHSGEIMKVVCPSCYNLLEIPISLKIWPALAKPKGGCIHTNALQPCDACDASRKQRKSLLELEIPNLAKSIEAKPWEIKRNKPKNVEEDDWSISSDVDIISYATDGKYSRGNTNGVHISKPFETNEDEILEQIEDFSNFEEDYNELITEFGDGD